jgi:hypothetical protein
MTVPTFEEWLNLTEDERERQMGQLNGYDGVGEALMTRIVECFREEFGHLPGIAVGGPSTPQGGGWAIDVFHDMIFDRRWLPHRYLGVAVRPGPRPPLPTEFSGQQYPTGYAWSPPNYERFVDRCGDEIRERLGKPNMSRHEMLHALIGRPFEEHVARCREGVAAGFIPPFE